MPGVHEPQNTGANTPGEGAPLNAQLAGRTDAGTVAEGDAAPAAEGDVAGDAESGNDTDNGLDSLTVEQLRERAASAGVTGYSAMNKAELQEAVAEAEGQQQ